MRIALSDDEVTIGNLPRRNLANAGLGAIVVLEADAYDLTSRQGWRVSVIGPFRLLTDEREIAELDTLGFAPWSPNQHRCHLAVGIAQVRSRRLTSRPVQPPPQQP